MDGVELHIGGQTRVLRFTTRGVLAFTTWAPGNIDLRTALVLRRDPAMVAIALAASLAHADKKITPGRVMSWVDADLKRYPEIEAKVLQAAEAYFREAGIIGDDEGEAAAPGQPAPAPSATGSTSSTLPVGTGSTPSSSSG